MENLENAHHAMGVRRGLEGCQSVRYCDICLYTDSRPHLYPTLSFATQDFSAISRISKKSGVAAYAQEELILIAQWARRKEAT